MNPAEALWLKHWTAQAVQCMFTVWHGADPVSFAADTSASIAYALQMVSTTLREAAQEAIHVHPLCTLPRHVLCNIWSHLTLADAVALSRTSRSLYSVVYCSPELWADISAGNGEPELLHYSDLQAYVEHSVAESLRVSLLNTGAMMDRQLPILARAMPRVTHLRLECCDPPAYYALPGTLRGSQTWSRLLRVLSEPAPRLVSFQLRHVEGEYVHTCDISNDPITVYDPLFSGVAPDLRRCRLASVLLPPPAQCGVFRNITTFSYSLTAGIPSSAIGLILEVMPRLEALELLGYTVWVDSEPGGRAAQHELPQCSESSLRVLLCSFTVLYIDRLSPLLPLQKLEQLWLFIPDPEICEELAELYPNIAGMRLSVRPPNGIFGSLDTGGGGTAVVFHSGQYQVAGFLAPFASSLTWLSVHEYLLDNSAAGAPPLLPALRILCVRLVTPSEYADGSTYLQHSARESGGFLIGDPARPPWELPALREVRLGAAGASAGRPLSIALHDVARWIRCGLAFAFVQLDAVVLSGIWVADFDFCAGWGALGEKTETIRVDEESDPSFFPAEDTMLYQTRQAALFPA